MFCRGLIPGPEHWSSTVGTVSSELQTRDTSDVCYQWSDNGGTWAQVLYCGPGSLISSVTSILEWTGALCCTWCSWCWLAGHRPGAVCSDWWSLDHCTRCMGNITSWHQGSEILSCNGNSPVQMFRCFDVTSQLQLPPLFHALKLFNWAIL